MAMSSVPDGDPATRARRVQTEFALVDGVYLIGSLERGVTVFGQQVRAHNIVWALSELGKDLGHPMRTVAVVGGGIAGLTAAACVLGLFRDAHVALFERSGDLCSIQQGCDTRWLHPRIYHWPDRGSRLPSASIPVLNWREGRASDVADQVLRGFAGYVQGVSGIDRLQIFLGVEHLRLTASRRRIEWVGRTGVQDGQFVRAAEAEGQSRDFDCILLAVGFGVETQHPVYLTRSYWRNEQLAQPRMDGSVQSFVVSGYGDGALIDLCRLTIERFRQDRILYDLFGPDLAAIEDKLRAAASTVPASSSIFSMLESLEKPDLESALKALRTRIRKDTKVTLQMGGNAQRSGQLNSSLPDVFFRTSSFTNRLLLYLLYRCGAFVPRFDTIEEVVRDHQGPLDNVICRYGPNTMRHVLKSFVDGPEIEQRLAEIKEAQAQQVRFEWRPGVFPTYSG